MEPSCNFSGLGSQPCSGWDGGEGEAPGASGPGGSIGAPSWQSPTSAKPLCSPGAPDLTSERAPKALKDTCPRGQCAKSPRAWA